ALRRGLQRRHEHGHDSAEAARARARQVPVPVREPGDEEERDERRHSHRGRHIDAKSRSAMNFPKPPTFPPSEHTLTSISGLKAAGVTAGIKASGAPDVALLVADAPVAAAGIF